MPTLQILPNTGGANRAIISAKDCTLDEFKEAVWRLFPGVEYFRTPFKHGEEIIAEIIL